MADLMDCSNSSKNLFCSFLSEYSTKGHSTRLQHQCWQSWRCSTSSRRCFCREPFERRTNGACLDFGCQSEGVTMAGRIRRRVAYCPDAIAPVGMELRSNGTSLGPCGYSSGIRCRSLYEDTASAFWRATGEGRYSTRPFAGCVPAT